MVLLDPLAGPGLRMVKLRWAVVALLLAAPWAVGQQPPSGAAASSVTAVTVVERGGEVTVVEIVGNAPFLTGGARHFHLGGELPREVLRIAGITRRYRPYTTPVGDANVLRVRVGHHPEYDPPELHVVFDLASDGVAISRVEQEGDRLLVFLSSSPVRGPIPPTGSAVSPTPAPTRTLRSVPTPTMTPKPEPTATPTPEATKTPAPEPTPTRPTAVTPVDAQASPSPSAEERASAPASATGGSNYRVWGEARPSIRDQGYAVRREAARLVTEIVTSERGDGSSVLRVSADGAFPRGSYQHLETASDPLRDVLLIRGVEISKSPLLLQVEDPNLKELEVTVDRESRPPYLRVEMRFTGPGVRVERVSSQGRHLVVLFSRR